MEELIARQNDTWRLTMAVVRHIERCAALLPRYAGRHELIPDIRTPSPPIRTTEYRQAH